MKAIFQLHSGYIGGDNVQFCVRSSEKPILENLDTDCWSLETSLLKVFIDCLRDEKGNILDFTGPEQSYSGDLLVSLQSALRQKRQEIAQIDGPEMLQKKLNIGQVVYVGLSAEFLKYEGIDWILSWQDIRDNLVAIADDLLDITEKCIKKNGFLWVFPV